MSTVDERYARAVADAQTIEEGLEGMTAHRGPLAQWIADVAVLHSRLEGDAAGGGVVCQHLRTSPGVGLCFASRPGLRVCRQCAADGAVDDVIYTTDAGCDRCGAPDATRGMVVRFGPDLLHARLCVGCSSDPASWPAAFE